MKGGREYLQQSCWQKIESVGNTTEGQDAIKRDLNKLERWANMYFMMFNKERDKVLHLEKEHFPGELKEIEYNSTLSANKLYSWLH